MPHEIKLVDIKTENQKTQHYAVEDLPSERDFTAHKVKSKHYHTQKSAVNVRTSGSHRNFHLREQIVHNIQNRPVEQNIFRHLRINVIRVSQAQKCRDQQEC